MGYLKRVFERWWRLCLGWIFILLGILGLFLPFLQGVLFLLIGLGLLSTEYEWARNLLARLRRRFPRIATKYDEAQAWIDRKFRRVNRSTGEADGS